MKPKKPAINFSCYFPASIYLFNVSNGNTRTMREICSKLTMKAPEQRQHHSRVFNINFEQISHIVLVVPLLKLVNVGWFFWASNNSHPSNTCITFFDSVKRIYIKNRVQSFYCGSAWWKPELERVQHSIVRVSSRNVISIFWNVFSHMIFNFSLHPFPPYIRSAPSTNTYLTLDQPYFFQQLQPGSSF